MLPEQQEIELKSHKELSKLTEEAIGFGLRRDPKFFDESLDGNSNTTRLWGTFEKAYELNKEDSNAFLDVLMIKLYGKGLWKRT